MHEIVSPAQSIPEPEQAKESLYCSFCLSPAEEVGKLVAGHGRIFICDRCAAACNDWIALGTSERSKSKPLKNTSTERLLTLLRPVEETIEGKSNQLQSLVEELRSRQVSWASIGEGLGISRQSAWERFFTREDRLTVSVADDDTGEGRVRATP